jgi:hypothetical protein
VATVPQPVRGRPLSTQASAACSTPRRPRSAVDASAIAAASGGHADRNASWTTLIPVPPLPSPSLSLVSRRGQRLSPTGVVDQPGHQLVVHVDAGEPGRALDHGTQRGTAQRLQEMRVLGHVGQLGVDQQRIEELSPSAVPGRPGPGAAAHRPPARLGRMQRRPGPTTTGSTRLPRDRAIPTSAAHHTERR